MRIVLIALAVMVAATSCREENQTPGADRLHELGANPVWLASCRDNTDDMQLDIFSENGSYTLVFAVIGQRNSETVTSCSIVAEANEGTKHWTQQVLFSGAESEVIFTIFGGQNVSIPFIKSAKGNWGDVAINIDTTQVYKAYTVEFSISYTNLKQDLLHCEEGKD